MKRVKKNHIENVKVEVVSPCKYCSQPVLGRPYVVHCDNDRRLFCNSQCYELWVEFMEEMQILQKRYDTEVNSNDDNSQDYEL